MRTDGLGRNICRGRLSPFSALSSRLDLTTGLRFET